MMAGKAGVKKLEGMLAWATMVLFSVFVVAYKTAHVTPGSG
jgi:hypothetical protein